MLDHLEQERLESNRRTHLAREAERRRIGQELHDEIGQRLTGILLELQRTLDHSRPEIRAELSHTQELTRATLDEVGRIAWLMRPGILDDLGIAKALEALVDGVTDAANASVSLSVWALCLRSGPTSRSCSTVSLRRADQRAATCARQRHLAGAHPHNSGGVRLELADNGQGLDPAANEGPGLRGMRERALSIGADLSIESVRGAGVQFDCL